MRGFLFFGISLCALSTVGAQEDFPYWGYVSEDRVAARSGPGEVHYATDHLDQGTKIEVYRHDPGGWCAIRPPDGSFSWVLASQVQMTDEPGVASVTQDEAKAWIGSRHSGGDQQLWQVLLRKGEHVEVIGEKQLRTDTGVSIEKWYKISPPAGEFRWIHQQFIARQPPQGTPRAPTSGPPSVLPNDSGGVPFSAPANEAANPSWRQRNSSAAPTLLNQLAAPTVRESTTPDPAVTAPAAGPEPVQPNAARERSSFESSLSAVEIELSRVLAQRVTAWDFSSVGQQATALLGQASSDVQRGQARLVLDKIDRFQQLRQDATRKPPSSSVAGPSAGSRSIPSAGPAVAPRSELPDGTDSIDPRYDAAGLLVPVHSRTPNAPAYALLDPEGNVLQYVTPVPGFNLRRYLRQEIGVYGQRGYIPHLKVSHVAARRVVVLDRHRR